MPLGNQPGKTARRDDRGGRRDVHADDLPGRATGRWPGEFRVVITQVTEQEPDARRRTGRRRADRSRSGPAADRIPAVYSDPYKSPVKAKVEAKATQIELRPEASAGARRPGAEAQRPAAIPFGECAPRRFRVRRPRVASAGFRAGRSPGIRRLPLRTISKRSRPTPPSDPRSERPDRRPRPAPPPAAAGSSARGSTRCSWPTSPGRCCCWSRSTTGSAGPRPAVLAAVLRHDAAPLDHAADRLRGPRPVPQRRRAFVAAARRPRRRRLPRRPADDRGALTCLLAVDYVWNAWHFAAQHHGIYRIYGRLGGPARGPGRRRSGPCAGSCCTSSSGWRPRPGRAPRPRVLRAATGPRPAVPAWPCCGTAAGLGRRRPRRLTWSASAASTSGCSGRSTSGGRAGLSLTTASALFHAIEYLALVSWSVAGTRRRQGRRWAARLPGAARGAPGGVRVVLGAGGWLMDSGSSKVAVPERRRRLPALRLRRDHPGDAGRGNRPQRRERHKGFRRSRRCNQGLFMLRQSPQPPPTAAIGGVGRRRAGVGRPARATRRRSRSEPAWDDGGTPFPFAWRDVAMIHLLCARRWRWCCPCTPHADYRPPHWSPSPRWHCRRGHPPRRHDSHGTRRRRRSTAGGCASRLRCHTLVAVAVVVLTGGRRDGGNERHVFPLSGVLVTASCWWSRRRRTPPHGSGTTRRNWASLWNSPGSARPARSPAASSSWTPGRRCAAARCPRWRPRWSRWRADWSRA